MTEIHPQVARALALHPLLEQEGDEVNRRRELTPADRQGAEGWRLLPHAAAAVDRRDGDEAVRFRPRDRGDFRGRWFDRLGGLPGQRLLDVGGVSGSECSEGDFRAGRRHPGVGTAGRTVRGGAGSGRLLHLRHMALCQRQPERDLAWGAYEGGGRKEVRTMLFPKSSVHDGRHLAHAGLRGTASNEYVVKDLFVPADHTMLRDQAVDRREDGPLYRFGSSQLYSAGFRRRRAWPRPRPDRRVPGAAGHQGVPRRRQADAGK